MNYLFNKCSNFWIKTSGSYAFDVKHTKNKSGFVIAPWKMVDFFNLDDYYVENENSDKEEFQSQQKTTILEIL